MVSGIILLESPVLLVAGKAQSLADLINKMTSEAAIAGQLQYFHLLRYWKDCCFRGSWKLFGDSGAS